jgi:hypothetical protein
LGGYDVNAADGKDSAPLVEPCELITKVEAEGIMGTALKEGQYSENKIYRSHLSFSLRSLAQPAEDPVALVA